MNFVSSVKGELSKLLKRTTNGIGIVLFTGILNKYRKTAF